MNERRRHERKPTKTYFAVLDRKTDLLIGCLADISKQGLKLVGEKEISVGTVEQLRLVMPKEIDGSPYVTFDATCVWNRQSDDGNYFDMGFRFSTIARSELKRIDKLMRSSLFRVHKLAVVGP
nr:PilZ domain-containing protein [candidate division Zixibacteria bacterium]